MRPPLTLAVVLFSAGCGSRGAADIPLAGAYTRAAYHLTLFCPHETPQFHDADLLYPLNTSAHTFTLSEGGEGSVAMRWDDITLATGNRHRNDVDLSIVRRDRFTPPHASWHFHGQVRDDFTFHERTLVGQIDIGTFHDGTETCEITPRSVAWFTTRARGFDLATVGNARGGNADGLFNRFVWFLDLGPLGMERKGDPGQRGRNLEIFKLTSTSGGRVATGDAAAFVDAGLPQDGGGLHPGSAAGDSVLYTATNTDWETKVGLDLLWDDGLPAGTSPGVHRLLAGFVSGAARVDANLYPQGWSGPTGMQPIQKPGLAYFLDLDQSSRVPSAVRRRIFAPQGDRPVFLLDGEQRELPE